MKIRESYLEPERFYHIFNRGVNSKLTFLNDENFLFFLRKAKIYLLPYFEIYAYCLMSNHFHFILKTKFKIDDSVSFKENGLHSEQCFYSKAISRFISSYTQSLNKVYQRSGPVFESPFKRILVDSEEYLRNLIIYIHKNPSNFQDYKFSSYLAIISASATNLQREKVLELFDDRRNFIECHQNEDIKINVNFVKDFQL
jgi:REP element-mobilizing transposase RayT